MKYITLSIEVFILMNWTKFTSMICVQLHVEIKTKTSIFQNCMWGPKLNGRTSKIVTYSKSKTFKPVIYLYLYIVKLWCIYTYTLLYLSIFNRVFIPNLYSSLCSEVFIPIHCCIYQCLIEYLYLCGVKLQKKKVFIKKESS